MRKLLLVFFFQLSSLFGFAQSSDELFKQARELGFNGQREAGRAIANKALALSPNYADIHIFIGRLYSWDSKYDSARFCFQKAISIDPNYLDAYSALVDAELWSENYSEALKIADKALEIDSTNIELLFKKSKGLENQKMFKEAYDVLMNIIRIEPNNDKAFQLAEQIKIRLEKNKIAFTYEYELFNKVYDPWHLGILEYTRRTKTFGTIVSRLNYAYRFESTGKQIEVDMYPALFKKTYAYLNLGLSPDALFPKYRIGVSVYRSLPKSFEIELGFRYLKFSTATWIYTGSIGKYWKDFFFSFKPNYIPGNAGFSTSFNLLTRYYMGDANKYLTLTLGSGVSPDDVKIQNGEGVGTNPLLKSNRIFLSYQKPLVKRYILIMGTGVSQEETSTVGIRTNYSFSLGVSKSF